MPSFLSTDNWLVRRVAAALFGWERNHQIDGSALAYQVDELYAHDRHFFTGFPDKWVVKKPIGCGGSYGDLRLTVTETYKVYNTTSAYFSDPSMYDPIAVPVPYFIQANEPECYSGGDGHLYDNWDIYFSADNGTDYDVNKWTLPLGGTGTNTYVGNFPSPYTGGGTAYPNTQSGIGWYTYGLITGSKVTPSQLLSNTYGGVYTTVTNYELRLRKPATASYAHAADVQKFNYAAGPGTYDFFGRVSAVGSFKNFATTVLWDDDWTATGCVEKTTCELRWKYNPNSTQGCKWWAGVQVQLKVTYKKAAFTKTNGPDGVFFSLGTFGAAGDWTTTVTLQDTYSDDFVSASHTMPSEEGYIYAIDDIEVLSVTHP